MYVALFFATRQGLGTGNKQPGPRFHVRIGLVQTAVKEVDKIRKSNFYFYCFYRKFYFFQI